MLTIIQVVPEFGVDENAIMILMKEGRVIYKNDFEVVRDMYNAAAALKAAVMLDCADLVIYCDDDVEFFQNPFDAEEENVDAAFIRSIARN